MCRGCVWGGGRFWEIICRLGVCMQKTAKGTTFSTEPSVYPYPLLTQTAESLRGGGAEGSR